LDRIQKKKNIPDEQIRLLKVKGLIEGRKPNLHVSADLAKITDKKAAYIKNRGFKDEHYKKMILEYLDKYQVASKQDIITLLFDILPGVLDEQQKQNKIRNILYAMSKRDETIVNTGSFKKPAWRRNTSN
jgi:ATP-dependent DNA helicase RecG